MPAEELVPKEELGSTEEVVPAEKGEMEEGHCILEAFIGCGYEKFCLSANSVIERVYIFFSQSCSKYSLTLFPLFNPGGFLPE